MNPLRILKDLEQSPAHGILRSEDFFAREVLIHSPLILPDMEKAVEMLERRILACRRDPRGDEATDPGAGEDILIAGDRDVDGVTSTVMLTDHLRRTTPCNVRFANSSEGDDYGLTGRFLERLHGSPAGTIILLDMGSAHLEQALSLTDAGKDVIILDHHIPQIPDAVAERLPRIAFVNPRMYARADDLGHQGKIATAGLVFKLILAREMRPTDLWDRLLRIDLPEERRSVLYRAGAFLAESSSDEMDALAGRADLAGLRQFRTGVEGLGGFCPVFRERSVDAWKRLLLSAPVEFGRYLFACSLLHRPALLRTVVQECDLASIGLIADLVPLVGENRRTVAIGLGRERRRFGRELNLRVEEMVRPGLLALYREADLDPLDIRTRDINFTVNPLINAAGRMGQTEKALDLLLCRDAAKARSLAADLRRLNTIRKERTEQNHRIVQDHLVVHDSDAIVFFYHPDLKPGISGLMATRLLESTGRPVVWVNPDGMHARGSARGRSGWNMVDLLQPLSPFLVQLGGHAEACGFTIAYDRIEDFRSALIARAREYCAMLTDSPAVVASPAPGVVVSHREIGSALMEELTMLEPFGPENPEPVLRVEAVRILRPSAMKKGVHLRFAVSGCLTDVDFVYWNCPAHLREAVLEQHGEKDRLWDLVGAFEKNRIPGMKPLRFRLCHVEPTIPSLVSQVREDGAVPESTKRSENGMGLFASGL